MKLYTILLGHDIWQNVIDDMNSGAVWGIGGMLWKSKDKAIACMNHLRNPVYRFETDTKKFSVKQLFL